MVGTQALAACFLVLVSSFWFITSATKQIMTTESDNLGFEKRSTDSK